MKETIIDSYARLPMGTYLDIQAVNADETREDVDKQVGIIALLTNKSEREILTMPIADYRELAAAAEFLGEQPRIPHRIADAYVCGDFKLKPTRDLTKITTAQYIDFQTFAPEGEAKAVELLSVFLVPEGLAYNDGYDIAEVQAAIRANLTVLDALALTAFFLRRYAALIKATETSLSRRIRKERNKAKREKIETAMERLRRAKSLLTAGAGSVR